MQNEIWKDIPNYEWLYQISNYWRVKSLFRYKKILKPLKHTEWYYRYCLTKDKVRSFKYAHRLVAMCFNEDYTEKLIINHKNWIKTDNYIDNLECITFTENNIHAYKIWLQKPKLWIKNTLSKKVNQYNSNWVFIKTWNSMKDVQRSLWIAYTHISECCLWKAQTAGGFIWEYKK